MKKLFVLFAMLAITAACISCKKSATTARTETKPDFMDYVSLSKISDDSVMVSVDLKNSKKVFGFHELNIVRMQSMPEGTLYRVQNISNRPIIIGIGEKFMFADDGRHPSTTQISVKNSFGVNFKNGKIIK